MKSDYVAPARKEPGLFFLPDVLTRIEGWSQQTATRTMPVGCSDHGVRLSPGLLLCSLQWTRQAGVHSSVDAGKILRGSGFCREMSKQESCVFEEENDAAEMGDEQKCCH